MAWEIPNFHLGLQLEMVKVVIIQDDPFLSNLKRLLGFLQCPLVESNLGTGDRKKLQESLFYRFSQKVDSIKAKRINSEKISYFPKVRFNYCMPLSL